MGQIVAGSLALCFLPKGLNFTQIGLNPLVGFLWGHSIVHLLIISSLCTDWPLGSHFNAVTRNLLVSFLCQTPSVLPACPGLLENPQMRPFPCLLLNPGFIALCCAFDVPGPALSIPWVIPTTPGVLLKVKIPPCY